MSNKEAIEEIHAESTYWKDYLERTCINYIKNTDNSMKDRLEVFHKYYKGKLSFESIK